MKLKVYAVLGYEKKNNQMTLDIPQFEDFLVWDF